MAEETPLKMLEKDHRKVEELFNEYKSADEDDKEDLTEKICKELEIHAELEEQLVYPVIEKASDQTREMISQSREEHNRMKNFISGFKMGDEIDVDDQRMMNLEKAVMEHVNEEETKVFPAAERELEDELGFGLSAKMLALKEKLRIEKTF